MEKTKPIQETVDTQEVIKHLSTKWKNRSCPMCGVMQWSVNQKTFELREFHGGGLVVGGTAIIPVIPVICGNCGNTILVSTIVAGLTKPEGPKNE